MKKKVLYGAFMTCAFFAGIRLGRHFCQKRIPVLPEEKNNGACKFDDIKAQIEELDRELEERLKEQSEDFVDDSNASDDSISSVINNWDNMFDTSKAEEPEAEEKKTASELLCDIPRLIKQDAKLSDMTRKCYEFQVAGCIMCYLKGIPFDGTMDRKELVERLNCTYTLFDRTERTVRNYINGYCASLSPLTCGEAKKLLGLSVDFALDGKVQNAIIEKEDNPKLYEEMEFWMKRMKERYLLYNNIYKENKQ